MGKKLYGLFIFILCMSFAGVAFALTPMETLGEAIYKDEAFSAERNQSCKTCHHPNSAFADPVNRKAPSVFPVSGGSTTLDTGGSEFFGDRNAPSAAYAGFSPKFHWNGELFIGGVFWDGRASGRELTATAPDPADYPFDPLNGTGPTNDPMADQAKGPFLNGIEMALTDITSVVDLVRNTKNLAKAYQKAYPGPISADNALIYNNIAIAIAAFERSIDVNKFSSRFDQFVAEQDGDVSMFGVEEDCNVAEGDDGCFRRYVGLPVGFTSLYLTQQELEGLALFNADSATQLGVVPIPPAVVPVPRNGGMCHACHPTTPYNTVDFDVEGEDYNVVPLGVYPPLFTDFSYDNLGIPVNTVARTLSGESGPDNGLGAQEGLLDFAHSDEYYDVDENGKFKVPSLRGVAKSAPYGHNGFFPTLADVVNFYNSRTGTPEVSTNMNTEELGNLDMDPAAVDAIVAFLKTLTDQ